MSFIKTGASLEGYHLCFHEKVSSAVSIPKSLPLTFMFMVLCSCALGWSKHFLSLSTV